MKKSMEKLRTLEFQENNRSTHDVKILEDTENTGSCKILKPGINCWTYDKADRVSFLIDGDSYYQALRFAILNAKKSVYITGWDIKSYTLLRDSENPDLAIQLISLLNQALTENPNLHIYIFCWKWTLLFLHDREFLARLKWRIKGHKRLHFKLDSTHPLGGSHHQKIVVIDDAMAFCGGIDLTDERWDTPLHEPHSSQRMNSRGKFYRPHHDIQLAIDGPIVKDLSRLFRSLWQKSCGEELPIHENMKSTWPDFLIPDFSQVKLAISRTVPWQNYEVKHMLSDALRSARKYIYIENQYFSWTASFEILCRKLMEPNGPEIIIVLPRSYTGRLEKIAIGKSTAHIIEALRSVDYHNRLGVYYPRIGVNSEHGSVKVHSKIMIVDGTFIKCGSANFSNRSMSVDTECDLAIESDGDDKIEESIEYIMFKLLAEHHDWPQNLFTEEVRKHNSILAAIRNLCDDRPRRLDQLNFPEVCFTKSKSIFLLAVDPPAPWLFMAKHLWTTWRYKTILNKIRKLGLKKANAEINNKTYNNG